MGLFFRLEVPQVRGHQQHGLGAEREFLLGFRSLCGRAETRRKEVQCLLGNPSASGLQGRSPVGLYQKRPKRSLLGPRFGTSLALSSCTEPSALRLAQAHFRPKAIRGPGSSKWRSKSCKVRPCQTWTAPQRRKDSGRAISCPGADLLGQFLKNAAHVPRNAQ